MRFYPFAFTGKDPRKGWRIPLNKIKYNEQRDEETGYGYFGARYMDHELMTMWLSVDPLADKSPGISPYNYCMWNPIKLMGPDGNEPVKPLIKYYGNAFWAVDVLVYAANMYQMIGIVKDNNELRRQTNLLNRAADMVARAIESGNMFSEIEATNNDFLGDVISYIYQGPHILNGGTIAGRTISPDAINKAKEIIAQNNLDYPLISY